MRDSFDYKLRVFIQDAIKRITGNEYAMNNITHDYTPLLKRTCLRSQRKPSQSHACSIYLHACMAACRSSRVSLLQLFKPTVNLPVRNAQLSLKLVVWYILLIAHPTCSPSSITKIEGVAFLLGNLQSLESQSGLCSIIRNCLTMHSKPNL